MNLFGRRKEPKIDNKDMLNVGRGQQGLPQPPVPPQKPQPSVQPQQLQQQQPQEPEYTLADEIIAAINLLNERIMICNENQLHLSNQVSTLNKYIKRLPLVANEEEDEEDRKENGKGKRRK